MQIANPKEVVKLKRNLNLKSKSVLKIAISHDNLYSTVLYIDGFIEYFQFNDINNPYLYIIPGWISNFNWEEIKDKILIQILFDDKSNCLCIISF